MYNKVVVPLDGSDLAEEALPHVVEIASGCNIPTVFLVSVTEEVKGRVSNWWSAEGAPPTDVHLPPGGGPLPLGSSHTGLLYSSDASRAATFSADLGRMAKTALDYLSRKATDLAGKGVHAEVKVLVGNPAEEILSFAEHENADLIVVAGGRRSGLSRWDMGNIANKVAKQSTKPVLLVKPRAGFRETKPKRRGTPT